MQQIDESQDVLINEHWKSMKISIPASTVFSSILRDIIWSLVQNDTLFSSKWKYRIQLMADELINNAIEHWSVPGDMVTITVTLYNNSDVLIMVEDKWTWWKNVDPETLMINVKQNREELLKHPFSNKSVRWRWLAMIVLSWSDEFSYEKNCSWWLTAKMLKRFCEECWEPLESNPKMETNYKNQMQVETVVF